MNQTRDEFREALARSLTGEIGIDWDADIEDRDKLLALLDKSAMVTYDRLIEEISDQAAQLRQRNRQYGKASATIGQLRGENALLRQQITAVTLGVTLADPRRLASIQSVSGGA